MIKADHKKNFERFEPALRPSLLFIQAYTYGMYNARLQLKKERLRYNDLLTVLIVGELNKGDGCLAEEFANILGYRIDIGRSILARAVKRSLLLRQGGSKGRGNCARFKLSYYGWKVYEVMKAEFDSILIKAEQELKKQLAPKYL